MCRGRAPDERTQKFKKKSQKTILVYRHGWLLEVTAAAAVGGGSARWATEVAVVVGSKSCCRSDAGGAEVRGESGESGS